MINYIFFVLETSTIYSKKKEMVKSITEIISKNISENKLNINIQNKHGKTLLDVSVENYFPN